MKNCFFILCLLHPIAHCFSLRARSRLSSRSPPRITTSLLLSATPLAGHPLPCHSPRPSPPPASPNNHHSQQQPNLHHTSILLPARSRILYPSRASPPVDPDHHHKSTAISCYCFGSNLDPNSLYSRSHGHHKPLSIPTTTIKFDYLCNPRAVPLPTPMEDHRAPLFFLALDLNPKPRFPPLGPSFFRRRRRGPLRSRRISLESRSSNPDEWPSSDFFPLRRRPSPAGAQSRGSSLRCPLSTCSLLASDLNPKPYIPPPLRRVLLLSGCVAPPRRAAPPPPPSLQLSLSLFLS